ncbi:MAG: NAD(P)H-binding protein [Gemmatimonadota bacterium]|nr:NAD(P)H-binding protein [Gemmatimonadota bacterium]MDH3421517.1 NAD(P)H-binding protein [Gemmatimonadota bacterium]
MIDTIGPHILKVPMLGKTRAHLNALIIAAAVAVAGCGGGSDAPEAGAETGDAPVVAAPQGGDMIIVTGASEELGGLVVDELLERGVAASRLILVSSSPQSLSRYASMGASTRSGDLSQPATLAAAYEGGDRMLLVSLDESGQRSDLHKNAIDAAVAAGVSHIAYTSIVDLDNNQSPLATDHRLTEQVLRESGVAWTMLRNNVYMDPLVGTSIDMIVNGSVERATTGAISYVTMQDCAAAAAAVLATDGHENQAYDITGPAAVFPQDIAAALTEVTELAVRVTDPSGASAGGPMSSPSFAVVSDAVQRLTGQAPMSVRDLLEAHHDEIMSNTGA